MKTIVVIGGSGGIGTAFIDKIKEDHIIITLQRGDFPVVHPNISSFSVDVLNGELPEIPVIDSIVYLPGSINLKPFDRLDMKDFIFDMDINFFGAVKVIQKYLSVLKKSSSGSIVLISTVAVKLGMPFHTSISSAKGAVEGLVKSLAAELAPTARINAIAPTLTDTGLASKILRNEKSRELSAQRHPLHRFLNPNEVAAMIAFLISDSAKSITGKVMDMDCGISNLKV